MTLTGRTRSKPELQNLPVPDSVSPEVRDLIQLAKDVMEGRTSPLVTWMKLDPPTMLRPAPDLSEYEKRILAQADNGPHACPICDFERFYGKMR